MDWEKKKLLLEIEKEKLLKWINFLQTLLLLSLSGTVSVFYHEKTFSFWFVSGAITSICILFDLLWNYKKLDRLKLELTEGEEE
jgi:hypothetical protein